METKHKTMRECGEFKQRITSVLYKNKDIVELILGDTSSMKKSEIAINFKKHVKSHLFVDDVITDTGTYIYYDVIFPSLAEHTKKCKVIMYLICHRDALETYQKEGYIGDRIDILSEMVEDSLLNDPDVVDEFGIGDLLLENTAIYNATRFYGRVMNFSVPGFRWR